MVLKKADNLPIWCYFKNIYATLAVIEAISISKILIVIELKL